LGDKPKRNKKVRKTRPLSKKLNEAKKRVGAPGKGTEKRGKGIAKRGGGGRAARSILGRGAL